MKHMDGNAVMLEKKGWKWVGVCFGGGGGGGGGVDGGYISFSLKNILLSITI